MISTKMFSLLRQSSSTFLKPAFFSSRTKQSRFSTLEKVNRAIDERIKVNEREGTNKFLVEDKNLIRLHMSEMNSLSAFLYKRGYSSTFFFYADNLPIIELNRVAQRNKMNSRVGFGVRDHYYDSYYGRGN